MKRSLYERDFYAKKAQAEGVRARSYYKLQQIDKKYTLIHKRQVLLDLGAAPGSWGEYVFTKTKGDATLVAVDCKPITPFTSPRLVNKKSRLFLWQRDVNQLYFSIADCKQIFGEASEHQFDGILSDLSPSITGIADRDNEAYFELAQSVIALTEVYLKPNGFLLLKSFQSPNSTAIKQQLQAIFATVKQFKPPASTQRSAEFFFIGKKK